MPRRYQLHFSIHGWTFEEVIANNKALRIDCEACQRRVPWPVDFMRARGFTGYVFEVAQKLRCSMCGAQAVFVTVDFSKR